MSRPVNHDYPAVRQQASLTYLPTLDSAGLCGAVLVLSDGTPFMALAGYPTPYDAAIAARDAYEDHLLGLKEPTGVFPRLRPWLHAPAEAEEMVKSFHMRSSGLPVYLQVPTEIAYKRLVRDAAQGHVKLLNPVQAAEALNCSRQNVHCRLQAKSLTPIFVHEMRGEPAHAIRKAVFCLASEIEALIAKKPATSGDAGEVPTDAVGTPS